MRPLLAAIVAAATFVCPVAPAVTGAPHQVPYPEGTPPAGFSDTLVTSVSSPTTVVGLPDGRVVVLSKSGLLRVIRNGTLLPAAALSLSVCAQSERGLLGFATDPLFTANGFVYVYYTRPSAGAPGGCVNRVSRFTMTGDVIANGSELVLIDNIGSPGGNHNGGDVEVGNDGYLYIAVGDGGCDPRGDSGCAGSNDAAQDLSLLNGKILRVDRTTGAPAPGNPFDGPGNAICRTRGNTASTPISICREIFAYGLRNPWRIAFDTNTGATRFHINDVGQNTREEVNLGAAGANYGWPAREGLCPQGANPGPTCPPPAPGLGYTQPINDYGHDDSFAGGEYITGGAFIPNGAWPAPYDGGYLFADGNPGRVFLRNAAGSKTTFASAVGGISDLNFVMEPTGWALYYVLSGSSQVRKIVASTAPAPASEALVFQPVTPSVRAFDTRNAGPATGQIRAGTSRVVNVGTSSGAARAAVVNITMVRPASNGFAAVWQPRTSRPSSSNINGQAGLVAANASVVPIDAQGNLVLFANVTTHLVVDVLGYFVVAPGGVAQGGRFTPVDPVRAIDTRNPPNLATNNYTRTADGAESVVNMPIAGAYGVTAPVTAVAVMVTGLADSAPLSGNLVVMPHGGVVPPSSNVNTNGSGDRRANLVIVPLGSDGSIDLRLRRTTDVIVDVIGSFTDASAASSSVGTYVSIAPSRAVDSRIGLGFTRLGGGGSASVNPSAVPNGALAVTQNVVIVNSGAAGFITAYPTGLVPRPVVSNGNATGAGQTRSTMALTSLGAGSITYYVGMPADVVADVTGYFLPGPS